MHLTDAIHNRMTNQIKRFLISGANPNISDENGLFPIIEAASINDFDIIKLLMQYGANPNAKPEFGREDAPALFHLCSNGNEEAVKFLLDNGADVDITDDHGNTSLIHTCYPSGNNLEIIKILLDHGANIEHVNRIGISALSESIAENQKEIFDYLISRGANINSQDSNPLCSVAQLGEAELVKFLVERGANVNLLVNKRRTPLMMACEFGHVECARKLMKHGADPIITNAKGNNALHYANGVQDENIRASLIYLLTMV